MPLSEALLEIARDTTRARISIADLINAMERQAMAALLLVFAIPNILPSIPGTSAILGIPLVYLTLQMTMRHRPWLPNFIANRSLLRTDVESLMERGAPWIAKAERMLKPRLLFLVEGQADRIIGAVCVVLAVLIMLPIPFGNTLPSISICLFALALLERDGVWVIAASLFTMVALGTIATVLFGLIKAAIFMITGAFG
jgi:hypothetical protein